MNTQDRCTISSQPFLTIGIASFNYAKYLWHAFEQIKKQTFRDFEILYCDDGSTDGSRDLILDIMHRNPSMNIRLICGTNAGILANRNRILENANGKYLMLCDADDYMTDNCLAELCHVAHVSNADCIIGGFIETDEFGHALKSHIPSSDSSKWLYTWHHAQIYKTELIRNYSLKFEQLPDDVCFLQQIHMFSKTTAFVPKKVYVWVRHYDSVSNNLKKHPEWNPVVVWQQLSQYIARLSANLEKEEDLHALKYFLYKWFYFNICDLTTGNFKRLLSNIQDMQEQMALAMPKYRQPVNFYQAFKTKDTAFAHCAVFGCWILESAGLLFIPVLCRKMQKNIRNRINAHAKA